MKKTIDVECESCDGTGLYSGMCEGPGKAVICLGCSGKGHHELEYRTFEGRKRKRGIKSISRSAGRFILTGVGAVGNEMTYAEFEAAIKP